ncbi:MAG: acyl-ACP--UDP-N-acetylglucosamine O-acyltransferase [Pyrinomonadaceae bacterium]
MSSFIHESAIIAADAHIAEDCYIGPFCTVGSQVVLARNVRLESNIVVDGITSIGEDTHVFPFVTIGLEPQDLKYAGEPTRTEIGRRNQIREGVTIHRGTEGGGGLTKIGDDNLLMAQVHIAHDCIVGNENVFANGTALAGHVIADDRITIGAFCGIHQFTRIGRESFIGAYSVVVKDPLPFSLSYGNHAKCYGTNRVGLRRRGHSKSTIEKIRQAFRLLLSSKLNTTQAVAAIREKIYDCPEVDLLLEFIEASKRGVIK